jgi:DNA replication and repair protein RecF
MPVTVKTAPNTLAQLPQRGLQALQITDFRNIEAAALAFSPGLNLISGENASGKTSLLEAIYCLGRVRSFRTHQPEQPIRYGQMCYRLVGRISRGVGQSIPVGIERSRTSLAVHLDSEPIRRLSDLAGCFSVQVVSADTPNLFSGGPRHRRQLLDWALFHVEQSYRDIWQRHTRILRQRNAALRANAHTSLVTSWDGELLETATRIDGLRQAYLQRFDVLLAQEVAQLLPDTSLELRYLSGWPANSTLAATLAGALEKDRAHGYTRYGVHRADFRLLINGNDVAGHCSRGQQKSILVAFLLAQLRLQLERQSPPGVFLLDDLGSELDEDHQKRVLSALRELDAQVFVSAIDGDRADVSGWENVTRFHVEHGKVREVL